MVAHKVELYLFFLPLPSPAPPAIPLLNGGPQFSTGIQTTVVFWPAKLKASGRVVMFRFEFWDCGESALKKFDHILPVSWAGGPHWALGGGRRWRPILYRILTGTSVT